MGRTEEDVALVIGTGETETELVELEVMVREVAVLLEESEGETGETSVDEVESVPLLGPLL